LVVGRLRVSERRLKAIERSKSAARKLFCWA
jgi:hypothetical protein